MPGGGDALHTGGDALCATPRACWGPVPLSSLLEAPAEPSLMAALIGSLEVPGDSSPPAGAKHPRTGWSGGRSVLFCLPLRSGFVPPSASKNSPTEKCLVRRKPGSNKGFFPFCPWLGFILAGGWCGVPPPRLGRLRTGVCPGDRPGEGTRPSARSIAETTRKDAPGSVTSVTAGTHAGCKAPARLPPRLWAARWVCWGVTGSTPILTDPRRGRQAEAELSASSVFGGGSVRGA